MLGLPLRLQAADHLRRQARGVLAEQRLQRLLEVPAGHATKVERRQNRIQRPRPPRETGQNGRRETDALSSDAATVPDLRAPHRHRTNASQDRPFRPVAMTHQAPAAVFGLQMFMRRQHGGNLRFNGLCQELASSAAEYCGQRIGRHPWMVQRDNTIFRHGVSLLAWRPGGFVTPHNTPPPSLSPSPTLGHSSRSRLDDVPIKRFGDDRYLLAPWTGTVGSASLAIVLACLDYRVSTFDGILEVSSTGSRSKNPITEIEDIAADKIDLPDLIRDRASALIFEKFHHYLGDDLLLSDALSRRLDLSAVPEIAQGLCSRL